MYQYLVPCINCSILTKVNKFTQTININMTYIVFDKYFIMYDNGGIVGVCGKCFTVN